METIRRCPLCCQEAYVISEKMYRVPIQSWRDPEDAKCFPARVRCKYCGCSVVAQAFIRDEGAGDAAKAAALARKRALAKWNMRPVESVQIVNLQGERDAAERLLAESERLRELDIIAKADYWEQLKTERSRTIEECKAAVQEMRSAYSAGEYYSRMGIHLEIDKILVALDALKEKP